MIHGFNCLVEKEIPEIGAKAKLFKHERTGAELMSLSCPDRNKVFGVSFRTPPKDSTGVPHILEHSVLCGSDKYPVKEPFVELLKGSLQTFLNAFTYPDKTCYPVASCNVQDFYNLIDVYIDAVFHPRIDENIFRQEGWHYELESLDAPLTRKGVVFNEMKGVYSSPESILQETLQHALYPDMTYGLDSGGAPKHIPDLTYAAFKNFHETYYHPSNARFWFYGDDDEATRLELVDKALEGYSALDVDSVVGLQPSFDAPRTVVQPYDGGADAKAMFAHQWLLSETADRDCALRMEVLEHILIGLPSSPLRRALMESGLGEDLCASGFGDELRQMSFGVGLKGMKAEDLEKAEEVVNRVLSELVEEGPSQEMIEAAMNSVEFDLREQNTGRFPRGLSLMLMSLTTWLYDGDPFTPLAFEAPLAKLKSELEQGAPVFQALIKEQLLENPHRITVLLKPEQGLAKKQDDEEKAELAKIKDGMSEAELQEIMQTAATLKELQGKADDPEALKSIPMLGLEDLEKSETPLPHDEAELSGVRTMLHDVPAQGIVYLDAGFDLRAVEQDDLPLIPLFGRALFEMGTELEDFASLGMRIARKTGGIEPETFVTQNLKGDATLSYLFLRGKAMSENVGDMLDILRDVLSSTKLDNRQRFRQIVMEEKARLEQRIVPAGHMVVLSRLRARCGVSGYLSEQLGGIDALFAHRQLLKDIDEDWNAVLARLERVRERIVARGNLLLNLSATAEDIAAAQPALESFISAVPEKELTACEWTPASYPTAEGLAIPAQVNYAGAILDLKSAGYAFSGAHLAVNRLTRMGYLWERVRVQGGAYGAFSSLDRLSGSLAFASYRDPNLDATLKTFAGTGEFFASADLSQDECVKSIVGAIGEMDAYLLPDAQGYTAMVRALVGETVEERQKNRDELLAAGPADFAAYGKLVASAAQNAEFVALGGKETLEASDASLQVVDIL
ncbi:insulinase family protein [Desulfobaculum bizertense]|uniref:insulinase family protein n=1 Tax=Desulfobaculum bizertense TaxID=376490 RepID=UPI001F3D13DD|nr:insulinase family protein [Desulfobaculum bizertense]UIJ37773.1 insulinase family protein [Desulfobaculum bizertense]